MTKRFVMFSSLLAVVAMFLGLMVTGCSEGDNTLPQDPTKTSLKVKVGLQSPTPKMDCPSTTAMLDVLVLDDAGLAVLGEAKAFAAEAATGVEKWDRDGDVISMTVQYEKDAVKAADPSVVVVRAYDEDGNQLGAYVEKDVNFARNVVPCYFTDDDSAKFVPESEYVYTLEVEDEEALQVEVGGTLELVVNAIGTVDGVVVSEEPAEGFVATTDSENITIDEQNVITGVTVSAENNVTITWNEVTTDVNVEVITVDEFDVTLAYAEGCEPQGGDVVTVEYAIGGSSQTKDLGKDNVICSGVEGTKVDIVNVWLNLDTEDEQVATLDVADVTISATEPNVVTVTAWNPAPAYTAKSFDKDGNETTEFVVGDEITVKVYDADEVEVTEGLTFTADGEVVTGTENPFTAAAAGAGSVEVAIEGFEETLTANVTVTEAPVETYTLVADVSEVALFAVDEDTVATINDVNAEVDAAAMTATVADQEAGTYDVTFTVTGDEGEQTYIATGIVFDAATAEEGVITVNLTNDDFAR